MKLVLKAQEVQKEPKRTLKKYRKLQEVQEEPKRTLKKYKKLQGVPNGTKANPQKVQKRLKKLLKNSTPIKLKNLTQHNAFETQANL